jgi:peptidyl-prolyl cis-trans isomerase C
VLLFLSTLALAVGCSRAPSGENPAPGAPAPGGTAAAVKPVPAELPDVVARVNDVAISRADFERAVQNLEGSAGGPVPATERDRVFRRVLDDLIGYRLLAQETDRRKVTVSDADVDSQLEKIRQQFPTPDAFTRTLAQQQLTLDELRENTRQRLEIEKLLAEEIGKKVSVTDEQVQAFYKENPQAFQLPEQVRASHILIRAEADADAAAKTAARARAESVLKMARSGKDFAALAKEYSQDPGSAAAGGDLGLFGQGQMVGPFNDAAFSLAPGTISDIVETEFGYHIIKVVDKQPARPVPLDEARPRIETHLQQVNRQRETQSFVQGLRSRGKVEVFI